MTNEEAMNKGLVNYDIDDLSDCDFCAYSKIAYKNKHCDGGTNNRIKCEIGFNLWKSSEAEYTIYNDKYIVKYLFSNDNYYITEIIERGDYDIVFKNPIRLYISYDKDDDMYNVDDSIFTIDSDGETTNDAILDYVKDFCATQYDFITNGNDKALDNSEKDIKYKVIKNIDYVILFSPNGDRVVITYEVK
jgi:hypothetical protein